MRALARACRNHLREGSTHAFPHFGILLFGCNPCVRSTQPLRKRPHDGGATGVWPIWLRCPDRNRDDAQRRPRNRLEHGRYRRSPSTPRRHGLADQGVQGRRH